jgi:hypothetical protein
MYKDYLRRLPTAKGFGVFTTVVIPAKVPIVEFKGDLFLTDQVKHDSEYILQIGINTFLGPSGEIDDYINHSCNPNCLVHIVGNRAILYSMYLIPANIELTFDYSTTATDTPEEWSMSCQCGSSNCRRTISGYNTLDRQAKDSYKNANALPLYITNPSMVQKKF